MAPTIVYLAGFRQHAGKTVTALGIISQLRTRMDPARIAYLKPVGQELAALPDGSRIDKDAPLMKEFAGLPDLDLKFVSPVRLGTGFTQEYLESNDHRQGSDRRSTSWESQEIQQDFQHSRASLQLSSNMLCTGLAAACLRVTKRRWPTDFRSVCRLALFLKTASSLDGMGILILTVPGLCL